MNSESEVLRSELAVTSQVLSCIIRYRYQLTTTEYIEDLVFAVVIFLVRKTVRLL
jgi:hypothetical protein